MSDLTPAVRAELPHLLLHNNDLYAVDKGDCAGIYANHGYMPVPLARKDVKRLHRWLSKWLEATDD